MRLLTKIDKFNAKEQYIVMGLILVLLVLGICLELFSPSELQYSTHCAFTCSDGKVNTYTPNNCDGTDPSVAKEMTFEFDEIDTLNRMMEIYFKGYLHPDELKDKVIYPTMIFNASLYYKENDNWTLWNNMKLTTSFMCSGATGDCESVQWIKELYFIEGAQKLELILEETTHKMGNICFNQYYGSDSYAIEKIVFCCIFTCLCVFYFVFYVIYLKKIKLPWKDLDAMQYLNLGLIIAVFLYNDPLQLLSFLLPSGFFPVFHGMIHMVFDGYLIIFIVKIFGVLQGKNDGAMFKGRNKWIPTIFSTLGLIFSFSFASSFYLKGLTENPFNVTQPTTWIAMILFGLTLFFMIFVVVWLVALIMTSFQTMYKAENTRACLYFIVLSFIVLVFEFGMLIASDYTSFYNSVNAPLIVTFEINIYLLCIFYFLLPLGPNEYAAIAENFDDEKNLFENEEQDVPMGGDNTLNDPANTTETPAEPPTDQNVKEEHPNEEEAQLDNMVIVDTEQPQEAQTNKPVEETVSLTNEDNH